MDLSEVDIIDPSRWAAGIPHSEFEMLRAVAPVFWHEMPGHRGFYAVTKYEDVVAISRNPKLFSSARGGTNLEDYEEEDLSQIQLLMVNMDPPLHGKYRKLISKGFTPKMTRRMAPRVSQTVADILDKVSGMARCDFVREVAAELPLVVIADLMGIPQEDRALVYDWSNRLIGFDDPEFQTSLEDARVAAFEIWMYANDLAESRRGTPGTDLTRVLMNAMVDGEELTEMEFDAFFLMLAVAGNETTRNAISGGLLALLENPDQLALLRENVDDEALMNSAVEEIIRWVTPVVHFRRTVTEDTVLRGVSLKENDKVAIFYTSANRDEEVFENASQFDITRSHNPHIAFGVGAHFCLGASLARLEIRILLEQLVKRLPEIRLDGPVRRLRSNFINGIKELPVSLTPQQES